MPIKYREFCSKLSTFLYIPCLPGQRFRHLPQAQSHRRLSRIIRTLVYQFHLQGKRLQRGHVRMALGCVFVVFVVRIADYRGGRRLTRIFPLHIQGSLGHTKASVAC